ncbi:MAG TPA: hypothetical protein VEY88_17690, partial [Archangium sp.]|nr:hypothetical protein [Archangium sp.]
MSSSPISPNGLRFLFSDSNERPFRPTLAWIKPEKGGLESWSLMLSPPKGQEDVAVVDDLKSWMLSGDKNDRETRVLALKPGTKGQNDYRKYHREEVLKRYLRDVIS